MLGAESLGDDSHIELKEVVLKAQHPWVNQPIRDLDISRQTVIVMVERRRKPMIPNGDLVLSEGDKIILCTKLHMKHAGPLEPGQG